MVEEGPHVRLRGHRGGGGKCDRDRNRERLGHPPSSRGECTPRGEDDREPVKGCAPARPRQEAAPFVSRLRSGTKSSISAAAAKLETTKIE